MKRKLQIGISSCLLGDRVRFDGGHKRSHFLANDLADLVDYHKVCPEFEMGLGIPRPSLQIQKKPEGLRLVDNKNEIDHTERMISFTESKVEQIQKLNLDGFILKKDSPSCGLFKVRVYNSKGIPAKNGKGFFARALEEAFPWLPMEDEGRMNDPLLRENFFERVFAYSRLQDFFKSKWTIGSLSSFHAREKFLLLAHDEKMYRELGRWVAQAKGKDREAIEQRYIQVYMEGLSRLASPKKHRNVLLHLMGFLKKLLSPTQKKELIKVIDDYTSGLIPLITPLTLLAHFVNVFEIEYLRIQSYLNPHSKLLRLQNYVR